MIKRLPLVLLLVLTGCKDPYGSSAKAGGDIALGIAAAFSTVDQLRVQGTITPAEELNVVGYLKFANDSDKAFLTCVSVAHDNGNKAGTYTACAQTFNTSINNPAELALIKVNNASASSTVNLVVNGLTAATKAIVSGLGGA
jgi:hypothetical protein